MSERMCAAEDPVHFLSATAISRRFQARQLSPLELMKALLDRVAKFDSSLNAFIQVDTEAALEAAKRAEADIMTGRIIGPLHGMPVGIKDVIDVAGLPTTCHSKILAGNIAEADAQCVSRLKAAGAIVVGKLSTHEFAIGGPSFDLPWPPARNPWNLLHHPGGSSSGSGAGVAAGFFPLALGTDTGGSVRNPASCCGIVGMKPTYGLVSRRGVFPVSFTMDNVGPMARTVEDSALMLSALAGYDHFDPGSLVTSAQVYSKDIDLGIAGLRIGFVRHFHEADMEADPAVVTALEEVARALRLEGARVQDVTLPRLEEFFAVNRTILLSEAWSIHKSWMEVDPTRYSQLTRKRLMPGAFISAEAYVSASRRRTQMIAAVNDAFREVDILLCASSMYPACRIDEPDTVERTYPRQARTPFNVTGHPALAMMSGLSSGGLPLSVQFAARDKQEGLLFRVARAWERLSRVDRLNPTLGM